MKNIKKLSLVTVILLVIPLVLLIKYNTCSNCFSTKITQSNNITNRKANTLTQPEITHLSWGKVTVLDNGTTKEYKDCKIWPGGSKEWNWKVTGTLHRPGIQIADVEELVQSNADIIILTRGMDLVLQVPTETIEYVKSNNKVCYVEQTEDAVKLYNTLTKEGKKVAIIIHSTC